jgi:hypothetical protein
VSERNGDAPSGPGRCPGCGLASQDPDLDHEYLATVACRRLYDQLAAYSLGRGRIEFVHQYVVDAYRAQHPPPAAPPISLAFALAGLHLSVDRGFSGAMVQRTHVAMARRRREWPRFTVPARMSTTTVAQILQSEPGDARDAAIRDWARSVWAAWAGAHTQVREMVGPYLADPPPRGRR